MYILLSHFVWFSRWTGRNPALKMESASLSPSAFLPRPHRPIPARQDTLYTKQNVFSSESLRNALATTWPHDTIYNRRKNTFHEASLQNSMRRILTSVPFSRGIQTENRRRFQDLARNPGMLFYAANHPIYTIFNTMSSQNCTPVLGVYYPHSSGALDRYDLPNGPICIESGLFWRCHRPGVGL